MKVWLGFGTNITWSTPTFSGKRKVGTSQWKTSVCGGLKAAGKLCDPGLEAHTSSLKAVMSWWKTPRFRATNAAGKCRDVLLKYPGSNAAGTCCNVSVKNMQAWDHRWRWKTLLCAANTKKQPVLLVSNGALQLGRCLVSCSRSCSWLTGLTNL